MSADPHRVSHRQRLVRGLLGLAVLVGIVLLDEVLFRVLFDIGYVHWYLENGYIIGIAFSLVAFAWGDLNKAIFLISANPLEYLAASVGLLSFPTASFGAAFRPREDPSAADLRKASAALRQELLQLVDNPALSDELRQRYAEIVGTMPESAPSEPRYPLTSVPFLDVLLTLVFAIASIAALLGWLLVAVPFQYFVTLVAGAPAREAYLSPTRAVGVLEGAAISIDERLKSEKVPEGAIESAFSKNPVSFTATVSTGLLYVVSLFV
ncbi:MAG TPA: hypothetical protein VH306_08375 [Gaiellaceae bacterium]